jgi:tetratricopeptide (TPR) repeat protein
MIIVTPLSAQVKENIPIDAIASQAYSLLESDPQAAELLFLYIAGRTPENFTIKRQLGYIYYQRKNFAKALDYFNSAESLYHSDTISLQIAYCLNSLDRAREAKIILENLRSSRYSDIRKSAEDQLNESSRSLTASRWWTRIYADPYYDTRWNTWFYFADIKQGYKIDRSGIVNGYGFLNVSGDSRSSGGLTPVIFSDNAAIIGLGVSIRPVQGLQFNTQYGLSYDFVKRNNSSRLSGDFRSIIIYGNGIYPAFHGRNRVSVGFSPLLDVFSSLGYYSRYENFIGYLQARAGARFLEAGSAAADFYLKGSLSRDSRKKYYNNELDGTVGVRLIPNVNWGLIFAAEFHRGYYWNVGTSYNPYDQYFGGFRFFIILERQF